MQILTHPDNAKYIDEIKVLASDRLDSMSYHPINLNSFVIQYSDLIRKDADSKTDFISQEDDRFTEFSTKNPSDWEVYFGFVKPVQVPNFIFFDPHRYTVRRV